MGTSESEDTVLLRQVKHFLVEALVMAALLVIVVIATSVLRVGVIATWCMRGGYVVVGIACGIIIISLVGDLLAWDERQRR